MLPFISTRGTSSASLAEALDHGLAPDGGLYLPVEVPELGAPPDVTASTFTESARWAAGVMVPDVDVSILDAAVASALDFPVPLVEVEPDLFVLELFHGPTHAFKDVGARFMASMMARLLPADHTRTILVATSGDTGGAVAAAFHDVPGFRVAVLYPRDGISERQRRQMTTLGQNVTALAVDGTFDDCQRLAKEAFLDSSARGRFGLTSANSINVGRLLPQAFYYVHAAAALGWDERRARFFVPCGNLGNLCAGLLAHRCGMPAAGFVAATNANDGFVEFLRSGRPSARPSIATVSNAMDVGDPSNLERIRWLYRDGLDRLRRDVTGVSVSDETTAACIADVHARTGYVLDPHTAVAYHAAVRHRDGRSHTEPAVVLATAHPAKFPDVVERAIGRDVTLPEGLAVAMTRPEHVVGVAPRLRALVDALEATDAAMDAGMPAR
jgi:threonine synthase